MKIVDILRGEEFVAPALSGTTKGEVIAELARHLAEHYPEIQVEQLVKVLWDREKLGSTAIGDGIAIPHGKMMGVNGVIGMFGRHVTGIDFESLDGRPTRLFFLLVAPEDSVGQHLKALARVSRLLKDRDFRDHLLQAPDRTNLYRLIREEDEKL